MNFFKNVMSLRNFILSFFFPCFITYLQKIKRNFLYTICKIMLGGQNHKYVSYYNFLNRNEKKISKLSIKISNPYLTKLSLGIIFQVQHVSCEIDQCRCPLFWLQDFVNPPTPSKILTLLSTKKITELKSFSLFLSVYIILGSLIYTQL